MREKSTRHHISLTYFSWRSRCRNFQWIFLFPFWRNLQRFNCFLLNSFCVIQKSELIKLLNICKKLKSNKHWNWEFEFIRFNFVYTCVKNQWVKKDVIKRNHSLNIFQFIMFYVRLYFLFFCHRKEIDNYDIVFNAGNGFCLDTTSLLCWCEI